MVHVYEMCCEAGFYMYVYVLYLYTLSVYLRFVSVHLVRISAYYILYVYLSKISAIHACIADILLITDIYI